MAELVDLRNTETEHTQRESLVPLGFLCRVFIATEQQPMLSKFDVDDWMSDKSPHQVL